MKESCFKNNEKHILVIDDDLSSNFDIERAIANLRRKVEMVNNLVQIERRHELTHLKF